MIRAVQRIKLNAINKLIKCKAKYLCSMKLLRASHTIRAVPKIDALEFRMCSIHRMCSLHKISACMQRFIGRLQYIERNGAVFKEFVPCTKIGDIPYDQYSLHLKERKDYNDKPNRDINTNIFTYKR